MSRDYFGPPLDVKTPATVVYMAGERTPDTNSNGSVHHSSDDDISLREHLQRQLDNIRLLIERLNRDEHTYFEMKSDERDHRYEQRFIAQEQAVGLALSRVDKEFHEHIQQVRAETHAALDAADKAIGKSEVATEKRFEGVNEFRAQLSDQARTFMGRDESISRHERTTEQMASQNARYENETRLLRERFENEIKTLRDHHDADVKQLRDRHEVEMSQVNSRLDLTQGRSGGIDKTVGWIFAAAGFVSTAIAIAFAFIGRG